MTIASDLRRDVYEQGGIALVRAAAVRFDATPGWTEGSWNPEPSLSVSVVPGPDGWFALLGFARLGSPPKIDGDGTVFVPSRELDAVEALMRSVVSAMTVSAGVHGEIVAQLPGYYFTQETPAAVAYLRHARRLERPDGDVRIKGVKPVPHELLTRLLEDRSDGIDLWAAMARVEGLPRAVLAVGVLERAFGLGAARLRGPLLDLLHPAYGYAAAEIDRWVRVRNQAAHGDFSGAEPAGVLPRLEQAAFDVLCNKADWGTTDILRTERFWPEVWIDGDDVVHVIRSRDDPRSAISVAAVDGAGWAHGRCPLTFEVPAAWWRPEPDEPPPGG